jgi:PKD repeat protein
MLKLTQHKLFVIAFTSILTLTLITVSIPHSTKETPTITSPDPTLTITAKTDKSTYLLRQKITIEGNITQDGTPATNLTVPIQITNPGDQPVAYRTLTIGNPTQEWQLNITDILLIDSANNPINTAKIGTQIQVGITLYNPQLTPRETYATVTVFDANNVSLRVGFWTVTIYPQSTVSLTTSIYIEKWACTGKALLCANTYSKEPKDGGIALSQEKTAYFCLSKTQQGLMEYPSLPPPPPQNTPGKYQTQITLPPAPQAGTYNIYAAAQASPTEKSSTSTTFTVENSAGYPPQASFAYWPATPYENQTVQFDASSSTPEGFNDKITTYKWNFGDGTSPITETDPYITHAFLNAGTYTVTLNVTDNEGLWSTTSKPITIYPEFNPTANFTWTPKAPIVNRTITFDASNSTLGWSKTKGAYSPIISYTWNFSDGTGNITVTTPTITHNFTQPGNYTVKLTILDDVGRTSSASAILQVLNQTLKAYDFNNDGIIDISDIRRVAAAYLTEPGDPNWDPIVDINYDNIIDVEDIRTVAAHYMEDP